LADDAHVRAITNRRRYTRPAGAGVRVSAPMRPAERRLGQAPRAGGDRGARPRRRRGSRGACGAAEHGWRSGVGWSWSFSPHPARSRGRIPDRIARRRAYSRGCKRLVRPGLRLRRSSTTMMARMH
jgi:hypothetical protein